MPLGNPVILYHTLAMRDALHLFACYTSATVWPFAPGHFLLASVLYLLRRHNQSSLNHVAYLFQEGRNTIPSEFLLTLLSEIVVKLVSFILTS